MTTGVSAINTEHILALEILLTAEKISSDSARSDIQTHYEELILDHLRPLVRGRLEQKRAADVNFARQHGQQRVHSAQNPISNKKVHRIAFDEMLTSLTGIKVWLLRNPPEKFGSKEDRIKAAVTEFERLREK